MWNGEVEQGRIISCKFVVKEVHNFKHSSAQRPGFIPYDNIQSLYSVSNKENSLPTCLSVYAKVAPLLIDW